MQDELPELPARAFEKADGTSDLLFYAQPRFVTHIDPGAIAGVTGLYRRLLPAGGAILDLMSSWVSHLPPDIAYGTVTGHGMNAAELAANPRLDAWFVQDLNADPVLKLEAASFDAACVCVSVQYLQAPVRVFAELRRVLRPGAPAVVTFSNRCFPTKAVAIWTVLGSDRQQGLVALCLRRAGFVDIEVSADLSAGGDPLWAVVGRVPGGANAGAPDGSSGQWRQAPST